VNYVLTVLANGRDEYLERALDSFDRFVEPKPAFTYIYDDRHSKLGMCAAHAKCWETAAGREEEWVFHLEEDFAILRPVDLTHFVALMKMQPSVKQVALVRCPWGFEIEWGGYIPQMPGLYERRGSWQRPWIATTRNWATNPALFRTELAREFPWDPQPGCETEIGPRIIQRYPDAVFGLWGWGEPWAAHIGVERAPGSHGY